MTCTGYASEHLPPGPERDKALGLIRLGERFAAQHIGRRRGFLSHYLNDLVGQFQRRPTYAELLVALKVEAMRRDAFGPKASPIEKVDAEWQLLTYHDPKHGRIQITFGTLKNHLSRLPLNSESTPPDCP